MDSAFLSYGINLFSSLRLDDQEKAELEECIKGCNFILDLNNTSNISMDKVLKAEVWIAAPLLGVQANILSYQRTGGLDYDLSNNAVWNARWAEIKYLETPEEALNILKNCKTQDYEKSRSWVEKSIRKFITLMKTDDATLNVIN